MGDSRIQNPIFRAQTAAPISPEEAKELGQKVEESLVEIEQAKSWDQHFEAADRAEIEILEAKLKAALALINHFLKTGRWESPEGALPPGGNGTGDGLDEFQLKPGWSGNVLWRKERQYALNPADMPPDVRDAEYAGAVFLNGNPGQRMRAVLQLSSTATKLEAFNHGKNIIYIETYKDDQGNLKKRYFVGVEHVNRVYPDDLSIDAHHLDHGVTIDMSRVYRFADGSNGTTYGAVGGFVITGSDYRDTIIGSQGTDRIRGNKGNDSLLGMGGVDTIFGDDDPEIRLKDGSVVSWSSLRGQLGLRTDLEDGDDLIDGGAGEDIIDGGGGLNKGVESDAAPQEKTRILEQLPSQMTAPATDTFFNSAQSPGWKAEVGAGGVVEIRETVPPQPNASLTLAMPPGFEMAFGEPMEGGSVKITMVAPARNNQPPKTFTVIIRAGLNNRMRSLESPFKFTFEGNELNNIIDFHEVNFENNIVHIKGGAGDEILLAPKGELSQNGLTLQSIWDSNNRVPVRSNEGQALARELLPGNQTGVKAEYDPTNNQIVISRQPVEGETEAQQNSQRTVHIDPKGYDKAYVMADPNGTDLIVILVKKPRTEGGTPQTVVLRIENYRKFQGRESPNRGDLSFLTVGRSAQSPVPPAGDSRGSNPEQNSGGLFGFIPLIYEDVDGDGDPNDSGVILSGGEGRDSAYHLPGDLLFPDIEMSIPGHYIPPSTQPQRNSSPQAANPSPPANPNSPANPGSGSGAGGAGGAGGGGGAGGSGGGTGGASGAGSSGRT